MFTFTIEQIFNIKNLIIYLLIINILSFLAMFIDKKKAQHGSWRIKEGTLMTLVLLGGGIGGIAGMYTFHHKTKKPWFYIGFPVITLTQIALAIYLCIK